MCQRSGSNKVEGGYSNAATEDLNLPRFLMLVVREDEGAKGLNIFDQLWRK